MSFPRDEARLSRVRALMAEREIDALVVRTPDNIVYLTNFWGMKGYDACVFPREGEPVLICLEASEADAARTAWTADVRLFPGYDPIDARPPSLRALELAVRAAAGYDTVAIELSGGTQASDRMVGEPTTFAKAWFDAFPDAVDATALLVPARAVKTSQEVERITLANEIAAAAMEHVRGELQPGMTCAQAAAVWQAYVHGEGTGWRGKVELALPFSLVWSGPSIRTFTATSASPVIEGEPTLFEIWVCADGYWADHTKNLVCGDLKPRYAELEQGLVEVYDAAVASARPGASLAELDRQVRSGIDALGFPGQPTHPVCHGIGARAHEPPYAHQAADTPIHEGMVLAIEPGCYWPDGGGLRVEDNFHVTAEGPVKLSPFPDGIVHVR
jgi:Xaa-Pro dipeptidase